MFVLMVAVLAPLLSDHPPELHRRAGLGDRFHYFRGRHGRRYLFTIVSRQDLADFRSAVVILAWQACGGRLAAYAVTTLDASGWPADSRRPWPPIMPHDGVVLVHLLAATDAERRGLVEDLTPAALRTAA